jgi:hypothetical protein
MDENRDRLAGLGAEAQVGVARVEYRVRPARRGTRREDRLQRPALSTGRAVLSGVVAGAVSVVVFTAVHDWLISDIWNTLLPMIVAGVLCGATVAWSYARLFGRRPATASWLGYNGLYVGLLVLLGLVSVIVYEPVVSAAELLEIGGAPPPELFRAATPLTVAFVLLSTAGIGLLWGRSLLDHVSVLLACTVVVVLLGLNVSILGLVRFTSGSLPLLGLTYALVVVLNAVFAAAFLGLERETFFPVEAAPLLPDSKRAPVVS